MEKGIFLKLLFCLSLIGPSFIQEGFAFVASECQIVSRIGNVVGMPNPVEKNPPELQKKIASLSKALTPEKIKALFKQPPQKIVLLTMASQTATQLAGVNTPLKIYPKDIQDPHFEYFSLFDQMKSLEFARDQLPAGSARRNMIELQYEQLIYRLILETIYAPKPSEAQIDTLLRYLEN